MIKNIYDVVVPITILPSNICLTTVPYNTKLLKIIPLAVQTILTVLGARKEKGESSEEVNKH